MLLAVRERAEPQIRHWARRRGVPATEIEDLLQTVLHDAWIRLQEIAHASCRVRWLVGVGCATIKEWRGHERTELVDPRVLGQRIGQTLDNDPPIERAAAADEREKARRWIHGASERHRSLLEARYIEGKPLSAVAEELGTTREVVRLRLRRAVAALKRAQLRRR